MKSGHWTWVLLIASLSGFAGVCVVWIANPVAYFTFMHVFAVDTWTHPFLDLTGVLSMGECHRLGIDVVKINPCDPLHRTLNYGPPLIYLPFVTSQTNVLGMIQSVAFLITAAFVLRPRSNVECTVAVVAVFSSSVLYELERANLDAFEFMLVALSGPLTVMGGKSRYGSYALYYLGGVLKFYPFALFTLILRERLYLAICLGLAAVAAIGCYAIAFRNTLFAIGPNLPPFEYNGDVFGGFCLPFGLADWLGWPSAFGGTLMGLLIAAAATNAWRIGRTLYSEKALVSVTLNAHYLIAGSIVLLSCFLLRPSITYRGIFLLLLLPGFWDLRRAWPRLFTFAIAVTLICLWSDFFRVWGESGLDHVEDWIAPDRGDALVWDTPSIIYFVVRESLWWWLVSLLAAIIAAFAFGSPAAQELLRMLGAAHGRRLRSINETA